MLSHPTYKYVWWQACLCEWLLYNMGMCNRHGVELAKVAAECHGPITQSQFLQGLGIVARLESLLENVKSEEEGEILISGWKRLTGAPSSSEAEAGAIDGYMDGMGLSYKAFCITRGGRLPPIPFRQT